MRPNRSWIDQPTAFAAVWLVWRAVLAISVVAAFPCWVSASELDALRKAATGGDPQALFELGNMYEQADTVGHDIERAAQYMRLAAERGHPEAQYRLGLLYAAGLGLPKDLERSYEWLTLAAAGEGRIPLLADALREVVGADLAPDAVTHAQDLAARFQPIKEVPDLPAPPGAEPTVAGTAPAPEQFAQLSTLLPPTNCGTPVLTRDERGRLIAAGYRPAGASTSLDDGGMAALIEHRGATLDLTPLAPQLCTVLDLIAAAAAKVEPPAEVVLSDPTGTPKQVFRNAEYLVVEVPPIADARYAAVDYFVHDGSVVHMLPSRAYPHNQLSAGERLVLGEPKAHGQTFQISAPFGRDLLVVFLSERPLYEGERAGVEPIGDYLDFLRRRLASTLRNDTVRVGYRVIQTTSG